jgi:hypothetical protein
MNDMPFPRVKYKNTVSRKQDEEISFDQAPYLHPVFITPPGMPGEDGCR